MIPKPTAAASISETLQPEEFDACRAHPRCGALDVYGWAQYDAEEYRNALSVWEQAHELVPMPRLLLSQGRCHFRLGHCKQAESLYLKYLKAEPQGLYHDIAKRWLGELYATPACAQPAPAHSRRRPMRWPWLMGGIVVSGLGLGLILGLSREPHVLFAGRLL